MTKEGNGTGPDLIVLGLDEESKPRAGPISGRPSRPRGQGRHGDEPHRLQGRRCGFG